MSLPRIHVIGLGPAGSDLVTAGAMQLIAAIPRQFLRTERHPSAQVMPHAQWFDRLYESGTSMPQVYQSICEALVAAAQEEHLIATQIGAVGEVLYAVPGSPVVAEHTVELLLLDSRVEVVVHPGLSFLDLTWARLGVDPVELGVRLIDGHRFAVEAAGQRGPLLVGQCDNSFTLSDIKLSCEDAPNLPILVLQRLGLPDERIFSVALSELDREVIPDHLTSLWIPEFADPVASKMVQLEELMRRLRSADPWKAEQTHASLKRYLLEESYEVFEAIDAYDPESGDGADELCAELGDLLYQVMFHSAIAAEDGWFNLSEVAQSIHDKLLFRHERIEQALGSSAGSAEVSQLVALWESNKQEEQGRESALDQIPASLPALSRALKVAKRASGISGYVAPSAAEKLDESDLGQALLALVDRANAAGLDPEDALRLATDGRIQQLREFEQRGTATFKN
ncbi:MAG: MazG nucleotide pyrophosphohydrolase domain-containing protein [Microthrixaceae bacterium]